MAQRIKTYKLPLIKRLAFHYPKIKFSFWFLISAIVIVPILVFTKWMPINLLYLIPMFIPLIVTIIKMFMNIAYEYKYKSFCDEWQNTSNHASIMGGPPGTGKSLSATYAVYEMSKGNWEELQYEYWLIMSKKSAPGYIMTEDDREVIESYEYQVSHDGIPCCASNIPIYSYLYKRYSYKFGPSYIKQQRRIPYRLAGLYDECGTVFNPDLKNDTSNKRGGLDAADCARYCRQWAELHFVGTEQDPNNIYINVRRVVALNRYYTGKIKIALEPKILKWIFNKLKVHFIKHMSKGASKRWAKFMTTFKTFINNVGYFKLKYVDGLGTESECQIVMDKGIIYLRRAMEFKYPSRAYRAAYKAFKMPINMDVFNSMELTKEEAEAFLRANYKK